MASSRVTCLSSFSIKSIVLKVYHIIIIIIIMDGVLISIRTLLSHNVLAISVLGQPLQQSLDTS